MFKTSQEIFITILLGALLFTTLSIVIVFVIWSYKRRQQKHFIEIENMQSEFENQLLRSQVEVQEETLSTLGKELHDNIGQLLSTTKMLLGLTERKIKDIPDTLLTANATLGKAINELRALTKSLSKEYLEQFDFTENLRSETVRLNVDEKLMVHFGYEKKLPLNADEQIILFRVIQEGLQNAIKHADAKNIFVQIIEKEEKEILLTIKDDGAGFDEARRNGIGMLNMKQRVKLLNGFIDWKSAVNQGTEITIQIPVKPVMHEN